MLEVREGAISQLNILTSKVHVKYWSKLKNAINNHKLKFKLFFLKKSKGKIKNIRFYILKNKCYFKNLESRSHVQMSAFLLGKFLKKIKNIKGRRH